MILSNSWADFVAMARPILAIGTCSEECSHEDDVILASVVIHDALQAKGIACAVNPVRAGNAVSSEFGLRRSEESLLEAIPPVCGSTHSAKGDTRWYCLSARTASEVI